MRGNKLFVCLFLVLKRVAIQEALIQAKAQIMFPLGDKGNEYIEKGNGNNYINKRRYFYHAEKLANIVILILNNVFNFQSSSHTAFLLPMQTVF